MFAIFKISINGFQKMHGCNQKIDLLTSFHMET